MAKTTQPQRPSYALNPPSGTVLSAPAGGQAEAEFDFYNDSPDVASFYLEVDGLAPDWVSGTGAQFEAYTAASGGGQLRVSLTPPLTAALGEYDFWVSIISGGLPVKDAVPLILRVEPPVVPAAVTAAPEVPLRAVQAPPVTPPAPVIPIETVTPIADIPVVETNGASPPAKAPAPPRARTPRPVPAPKTVAPEPAPVPEPAAEEVTFEEVPFVEEAPPIPVVVAAPPPAPVRPTPIPRPAPEPEPIAVFDPEPKPPAAIVPPPTPRPVPQPSRPAPAPRPAAPPPEEVLVDYTPLPGAVTSTPMDDDEDETINEPFILDPKDGSIIALRPAETMLVRLPFINDMARERTYILDEDRSLEDGWLTLVQDQVNLTRNGSGQLSVRLTPPINAEPGDYTFTLTAGPQGGMMIPRTLTLSVLATPAVQITAKETLVKIGPMSSTVEFPLTIESIGNADTAFRIAVKAPRTDATTDGAPAGPSDLYETPQWRYLFDKELETLRSPAAGRAPRPVPILLRVRRKGIWWWGFKEQHQLRAEAVPVTEPGNGGKPGNIVELTAVRWRPLPFPALLLIPILLLIALFFSGGASDLSAVNPQYSMGNECWIVDPKGSDTKTINLRWQAMPFAMLRLTGAPQGQENAPKVSKIKFGGGTFTDQVPVSTGNRNVTYHYLISRFAGGGDQDVFAHFVYTRPDTPLAVTAGHRPAVGSAITLLVPSKGYGRLDLTNTATQNNRLDWWLIKSLSDTGSYKFKYIKNVGSLEPGATEHFLIERTDSGDSDPQEQQIVFITTDSNRPVLTVTLKQGP